MDVTNPLVFLRARDLELDGTELSATVNANPGTLDLLEEIRQYAAILSGIHANEGAAGKSNMPAIALVAPPRDCVAAAGVPIAARHVDLLGCVVSVRRLHRAYAATGAVCTAAAARLTGTIPHEVAAVREDASRVTIGQKVA